MPLIKSVQGHLASTQMLGRAMRQPNAGTLHKGIGAALGATSAQSYGRCNPAPGPKFDYKLRWLERLIVHAAVQRDSDRTGCVQAACRSARDAAARARGTARWSVFAGFAIHAGAGLSHPQASSPVHSLVQRRGLRVLQPFRFDTRAFCLVRQQATSRSSKRSPVARARQWPVWFDFGPVKPRSFGREQ